MTRDYDQYILHADPVYIERLYEQYSKAPDTVDAEWKRFFEGFEFALKGNLERPISTEAGIDIAKELRVYQYIEAFRYRGHLIADTNPIKVRKDRKAHLDIEEFGLSEEDLSTSFYAGAELGMERATLQEIIDRLWHTYGRSIGIEWEYIRDPKEKAWLKHKMEIEYDKYAFNPKRKKEILRKLNETILFEKFLGTKYLGEKRFSLEGCEAAIPALDFMIIQAVELGVREVAIGMAHRGRLNVLANLLKKTYAQIFSEFEGENPEDLTMGDGDVKYHLGFSSMKETPSGKSYYIKLAPNPSHLESVDPVVEGFVRGKDDIVYHSQGKSVMPILVHGDAAVAGQGVVYETMQLSRLDGYQTGGTVHLIINNQIGFTTDFDDARSSDYSTAAAGVVRAPVFHVNGDDVEAVVFVAQLAAEWRQTFHRDVFVDMVAYRKHGHNEADDPKYTQPMMYAAIAAHKNVRDIYVDQLLGEGVITAEEAKDLEKRFWADLQSKLKKVKEHPLPYEYQAPELAWKSLRAPQYDDFVSSPKTGVEMKTLRYILERMTQLPKGFSPLRKAEKLLKSWQEMGENKSLVDWGMAEMMAYGSILMEGRNVRLSGQDSRRGTFAHRHAVIYDRQTNAPHNRLSDLGEGTGQFLVYNSPLSEFAVVGFDYGYSLTSPENLVVWEAQFGDFANGGQVIFDQYLSGAYSKWHRMSGLVLLLPHGYEGQGPEHSSARLERWLQLCAELNLCVINPTTPANMFHALRRQLAWPFRIPLIVMSPKSLLRHPRVVSPMKALAKGHFEEVIWDEDVLPPAKVKRVALCTGKIYYELLDFKEKENRKDVAIIRFEQLYPFPQKAWERIIEQYPNAEICWVQEEPSNMGAWAYILTRTEHYPIRKIARLRSASTAIAFKKVHIEEQNDIVKRAFE